MKSSVTKDIWETMIEEGEGQVDCYADGLYEPKRLSFTSNPVCIVLDWGQS